MKRVLPRVLHAASAVTRARGCLAALLLALCAGGARADDVTVTVDDHNGLYQIEGEFVTSVTPALAWSVLTDYDHIAGFVHAIRVSAIVRGLGGERVLQQDAVAGVFPLRRIVHVMLVLHEDTERTITFRDQLGRDFRVYSGTWTLERDAAGTRIRYVLEVRPRFRLPAFLGRGMLSGSARDLLTEVRIEMLHRAGVASARTDSGTTRHREDPREIPPAAPEDAQSVK